MSTTTFGTIATRLPPQIRRVLATVFVQTQQDNEHNFGFNWHERTINSEKVIIKKNLKIQTAQGSYLNPSVMREVCSVECGV